MPGVRYEDADGEIRKVGGGYVLRVNGPLGTTTLLIRNDGAMMDVSGEPVLKSDITIARDYLSRVEGGDQVRNLRQGNFPKFLPGV